MRKIIKLKNARRIDDPSVRIKKIPVDGTTLTFFLDKNIKFIESPTRFIQYLERSDRYSSLTAQEYAKILKDFLLFLIYSEDVNKLDFDSIIASCGSLQIEEYISDLRSRGKRPKTIRTRDGCLKSFFDWLTTEEGGNHITRDNNPYSNGKLKSRSGQRDAIKYLTCQEFVEFIRNGLTNEFERCVAHFIFDTGARISEVRRVRLGDLPDIHQSHPDQTYFKILIRGSKAPGGGIKKRYSIISRAMLDRL